MEPLFSTQLTENGKEITFRVVFDHEQYLFLPEADESSFHSFSFMRAHDAWVPSADVPEGMREQALDALEKYLMRQL